MPGDDGVRPGDPPPPEDEFDDVTTPGDQPLAEHELYDDETLARLDAWRAASGGELDDEPSMSRIARWSRDTAFGAVLRGSTFALQDILRPEDSDPVIVIEVDEDGQTFEPPVRLYFDPASPSQSVAIVRPWVGPRQSRTRRH